MNRVAADTATADLDPVAALRAGSRDAFEELYHGLVGRVHALGLHLAASAEVAEEMTQEAFIRAWKHRRGFESRVHLERWLRRVVVNLWRSRLRTLSRRGPTEALDPELADAGPTPGPATGGLRLDLREAVSRLPAGARTVLVLHDVYGLKHREIADALGCAVGTSKAQLHVARKQLRRWLQS